MSECSLCHEAGIKQKSWHNISRFSKKHHIKVFLYFLHKSKVGWGLLHSRYRIIRCVLSNEPFISEKFIGVEIFDKRNGDFCESLIYLFTVGAVVSAPL